jgi:gluconate 2-dehydrogenase gamma chain
MKRRQALFSLGALMAAPALAVPAKAAEMHGYPEDMALNPDFVPQGIRRGAVRLSLTDDTDYKTVKAVFDRLMPADELGPSASGAGCLDFLDAQLAGRFGEGQSLYRDSMSTRSASAWVHAPIAASVSTMAAATIQSLRRRPVSSRP